MFITFLIDFRMFFFRLRWFVCYFRLFSAFSNRYNLVSFLRWCTVAASVDRLQLISIIEFCVWVPHRKIQTIPSTSSKMHGGERAFQYNNTIVNPLEWAYFIYFKMLIQPNEDPLSLFRSMHYPPETSSIMLMARMVAVVKQVSLFRSHDQVIRGLVHPGLCTNLAYIHVNK